MEFNYLISNLIYLKIIKIYNNSRNFSYDKFKYITNDINEYIIDAIKYYVYKYNQRMNLWT